MHIFSSIALAANATPASKAMEAITGSSLGKSLIVIIFFVTIALFLRFMYGPKGIRREKHWDDLNREFNAKEADKKSYIKTRSRVENLQKELELVTAKEGRIFSDYVRSFFSGDAKKDELYRLKDEHSNGVFKNAWQLIQGEALLQEPQVARATLLAALYHDIGRFEQLRLHHTFDDAISLNHAVLGAKTLSPPSFMPDENPETRRLVRATIAMHNRAALPKSLDPTSRLGLTARALRDADKLDIIRIMQEALLPGSESDPAISFNLPDEPGSYVDAVAQAVMENRLVCRSDRRFRNDFRLYVCNWVGFLEFKTSLRLLSRSGHIESILLWLPQDKMMDQVRAAVRARLVIN